MRGTVGEGGKPSAEDDLGSAIAGAWQVKSSLNLLLALELESNMLISYLRRILERGEYAQK